MNEKSITSSPASQDHTALDKPAAGSTSLVAETVGERLKRIYPEHYVRIITEMNRVNGADRTAKVLSMSLVEYLGDHRVPLLISLFIWDRTAEGRGFWAELAERER